MTSVIHRIARRRFILGATLAFGLSAKPWRALAAASKPLASPWIGLGAMSVRVGNVGARITLFDNDDLLAELSDEADVTQSCLALQPSGKELYFGLPTDRGPFGATNPFLFLDAAFAVPLAILDRAYPGGPANVPAASERRIVGWDRQVFALETHRIDNDLLAYTLDGYIGSISGEIRSSRTPAWPDDRSLTGWTTGSFESFATLGLARTTAFAKPLTRFDHQRLKPTLR